MHTFQTYDLFRLSCFQKRKPDISFLDTNSFTCYRFNEVDYFNYIFFKTADYDKSRLAEVFDQFLTAGRSEIKILFPTSLGESLSGLIQRDTQHKITCLQLQTESYTTAGTNANVLSLVNTVEDLFEYTRIYLEAFGSENTNYTEIAKNFELLWLDDRVDFFFVNHESKRVGICSNYYGVEKVFLSAGAILSAYRNDGLHKQAITERIKQAQVKGYSQFSSWAYSESVSCQNLIKSGFTPYSYYFEYVSKPLESLIGQSALLSR